MRQSHKKGTQVECKSLRWLIKLASSLQISRGAIAQLGERIVRNDEVVGSIPTSSTKSFNGLATIAVISVSSEKPTYWTVMDRESLANSESCSSARRCANGTICA
jgi:hypothetical protein